MDPESEEGNIEYKRKIGSITEKRFRKLATQMLRRLKDGNGVAIYILGIEDDGTPSKVGQDVLRTSLRILKNIARFNKATIKKIERIKTHLEVTLEKMDLVDEELPSL